MQRYGYPSMDEFITLESATISYLRNNSYFCQNVIQNKLRGLDYLDCIISAYQRRNAKARGRKGKNLVLETDLSFIAPLEGKGHKVRLGMCVQFINERLTFSSYIIEIFGPDDSTNKDTIITRIHFDVALPGQLNKNEHPLYHVQVGGASNSGAKICYENKLSFPRIPCQPMSLALFLDMAMRELGPLPLKIITKQKSWNNIVRANEEKMIYALWDIINMRRKRDHKFILPSLYYES